MRPSLIAVLLSATALAGCDLNAPAHKDQQAVDDAFALIAVMAGEDLDRRAPEHAPHKVQVLWRGKDDATCGEAVTGGAGVRFLQPHYGGAKALTVEGEATWNAETWAATCSDRSRRIFPPPP